MRSDIVIVGAGASGIMCASFIAYRLKSMGIANLPKITLVERNERIGRKILATGNGRCNMTNLNMSADMFETDDYIKLDSLLKSYSSDDFLKFINEAIGIEYCNIDSWVYPKTLRSNTVLDSLRSYLNDFNIEIITDCKVTSITENSVSTEKSTIDCNYVVVAVGGASYPSLGTDGTSYNLSSIDTIDFVKPIPALVPLKTADSDIKTLHGVKQAVTISVDNTDIKHSGEILFTDYGISGICTMQISGFCNSYAISNGKYPRVIVDLLPDYSLEELRDMVVIRIEKFGNRSISSALSGIIRENIIELVLNRSSIQNKEISLLTNSEIQKLIKGIKSLVIRINGTLGFENSQVTRGGIKLSSLDDSLKYKNNIYYIGEVVNVDGLCGGYNLQWAWTSAMAVADNICKNYV